jgi:hypothetical protein
MRAKPTFSILAVLSLLACLAAPVLFFFDKLDKQSFQTIFAVASAGWFIFAVLLNQSKKKGN